MKYIILLLVLILSSCASSIKPLKLAYESKNRTADGKYYVRFNSVYPSKGQIEKYLKDQNCKLLEHKYNRKYKSLVESITFVDDQYELITEKNRKDKIQKEENRIKGTQELLTNYIGVYAEEDGNQAFSITRDKNNELRVMECWRTSRPLENYKKINSNTYKGFFGEDDSYSWKFENGKIIMKGKTFDSNGRDVMYENIYKKINGQSLDFEGEWYTKDMPLVAIKISKNADNSYELLNNDHTRTYDILHEKIIHKRALHTRDNSDKNKSILFINSEGILQMSDDVKCGEFRKLYKDKPEYGCISGNCKDGYGEYLDEEGSKYSGNWEGGVKSGSGKQIFSNGNVYDGNWENNKMHGSGIMKFSKGDEYDGNWINDNRSGYGKYTWNKGSYFPYYVGEFLNGQRHGYGKYKDFYNGDREGNWEYNSFIDKNDYSNAKSNNDYSSVEISYGEWKAAGALSIEVQGGAIKKMKIKFSCPDDDSWTFKEYIGYHENGKYSPGTNTCDSWFSTDYMSSIDEAATHIVKCRCDN